jgi:hypothetical protein
MLPLWCLSVFEVPTFSGRVICRVEVCTVVQLAVGTKAGNEANLQLSLCVILHVCSETKMPVRAINAVKIFAVALAGCTLKKMVVWELWRIE